MNKQQRQQKHFYHNVSDHEISKHLPRTRPFVFENQYLKNSHELNIFLQKVIIFS